MSEPTLTDFLLARIAEDEDLAAAVGRAGMSAFIEAKRRIVEWHDEAEECCEERYGPMVFDAEPELSAGVDSFGQLTMRQSIGYEPYIGCVTLMLLALPYAYHPDYRQEWKP